MMGLRFHMLVATLSGTPWGSARTCLYQPRQREQGGVPEVLSYVDGIAGREYAHAEARKLSGAKAGWIETRLVRIALHRWQCR
jgi:hypothetical protein